MTGKQWHFFSRWFPTDNGNTTTMKKKKKKKNERRSRKCES